LEAARRYTREEGLSAWNTFHNDRLAEWHDPGALAPAQIAGASHVPLDDLDLSAPLALERAKFRHGADARIGSDKLHWPLVTAAAWHQHGLGLYGV
jgi:hypothetical protein